MSLFLWAVASCPFVVCLVEVSYRCWKKRQALHNLRAHRDALTGRASDLVWETKTAALLLEYLGPHSPLYLRSLNMRVTSSVTVGNQRGVSTRSFDHSHEVAALMGESIAWVQSNGLYDPTPYKGSIHWTIVTGAITFAFMAGVWVGTLYKAGLWPF